MRSERQKDWAAWSIYILFFNAFMYIMFWSDPYWTFSQSKISNRSHICNISYDGWMTNLEATGFYDWGDWNATLEISNVLGPFGAWRPLYFGSQHKVAIGPYRYWLYKDVQHDGYHHTLAESEDDEYGFDLTNKTMVSFLRDLHDYSEIRYTHFNYDDRQQKRLIIKFERGGMHEAFHNFKACLGRTSL